jgi:hypothetical protein
MTLFNVLAQTVTLHDLCEEIRTRTGLRAPREWEFDSARAQIEGVNGLVVPGEWVIHLSPGTCDRLKGMQNGDESPHAMDSIRTVVHELWHRASPLLASGTHQHRRSAGKFFEEGIAEHRAREFVGRHCLGSPNLNTLLTEYPDVCTSRVHEATATAWLESRYGTPGLLSIWQESTANGRLMAVHAMIREDLATGLPTAGVSRGYLDRALKVLDVSGWRLLVDSASAAPHADTLPINAIVAGGGAAQVGLILHDVLGLPLERVL